MRTDHRHILITGLYDTDNFKPYLIDDGIVFMDEDHFIFKFNLDAFDKLAELRKTAPTIDRKKSVYIDRFGKEKYSTGKFKPEYELKTEEE